MVMVIALTFIGCGDKETTSEPEEVPLLTEENEEKINSLIDKATMYEKAKLESDAEKITVWIDLKDNAIESAEEHANNLTNEIAQIYDYDIKVQVTAMQSIEDSEKVRAFGNSLFTPASGKTKYKAY